MALTAARMDTAPRFFTRHAFRCTSCRVQDEAEPQQPDEPRRLGYKLFTIGKDAADYYRNLVNKLTKNQDLNEVCILLTITTLPQHHQRRMQNS